MKSSFIYPVAAIFLLGVASLPGAAQCVRIRDKAPVIREDLHADSTYTFNTQNTNDGRKFRMVIATRDSKGNYHPVGSIKIAPGECESFDYPKTGKLKKDETVYVTYKYKHWTHIFWNTIDSVREIPTQPLCYKTPKSKRSLEKPRPLLPTRRSIVGDSGGSGTATTTIDEK